MKFIFHANYNMYFLKSLTNNNYEFMFSLSVFIEGFLRVAKNLIIVQITETLREQK